MVVDCRRCAVIIKPSLSSAAGATCSEKLAANCAEDWKRNALFAAGCPRRRRQRRLDDHAQRLQSTTIVIGPSRSGTEHEQSRLAGLAWEKLAEPRPRLYLEMVENNGAVRRTRLGPHAPQLRPEDVETLHRLWLDLTTRSELRQLHHHQILSVALRALPRVCGAVRKRRRSTKSSGA